MKAISCYWTKKTQIQMVRCAEPSAQRKGNEVRAVAGPGDGYGGGSVRPLALFLLLTL